MKKLIIKNFGPIHDCEVLISGFTILIGPQSSGKSTISKLVFFFLHLRECIVDFILDEQTKSKNSFSVNLFTKHVRRRFLEFFGPGPSSKDLLIRFDYGGDNTWAEIKLDNDQHKYVTPKFSESIIEEIKNAYSLIKETDWSENIAPSLFSTPDVISKERTRAEMINHLKSRFASLFRFDKELLFIPAGRSLLSTISDQLQNIHPHQLDYPMRLFIERINATKSFFSKSLEDIIKDKHILENSLTHRKSLVKAVKIINEILKAEYRHDSREGGKFYLGKGRYTKINFASSGQQESVWILLSMFLVLLDKVDAFVFIEEPEAHLFPIAQKDMMALICYAANLHKCQFMITTHSPYILSALNNHIYAHRVGKNDKESVLKIIPREQWIDPSMVGGCFVYDGFVENLFDNELTMLRTELVDTASDIVNNEYDQLFSIEHKYVEAIE